VVCPRRGRVNEKNWMDHNSAGEFWGSHVVLDDGANAVCTCSVLFACCDNKAVWFEQERERGHSSGQVVAVRCELHPLLCCALVLVAQWWW